MNSQELILNEKHRGDCYKFLAACFYPPEKELLLQENLLENLSHSLSRICPQAGIFAAKMEEAIRRYSHQELSVEYARLFLGPYELQAPPYGSIYLDGQKRVMGDSTMEVLAVYQEAGLSLQEDFKELPDHIAVELEFMYYLTYQEVRALENHDGKEAGKFLKFQENFLENFLGRWVPPFCARIKEGTQNEFYAALADCLDTLVYNPLSDLLPLLSQEITTSVY